MIGNIYKIEFNEYTYIGSTTNIKVRQYQHNIDLKNSNLLLYKKARDCNISNIECILIEEVEVDSRLDLRKIEQNYINKYKSNLNSNCAYLTDDLKLYKKMTDKNKEANNEYGKKYYHENKEILKEKRKIYTENNKEIIKEYQQIYRDKNKDVIKQKNSEKIPCRICNKLLHRNCISRHIKTLH